MGPTIYWMIHSAREEEGKLNSIANGNVRLPIFYHSYAAAMVPSIPKYKLVIIPD